MQTTVTRKFQVTIPKQIRQKLRIRIGDRLDVGEQNGGILLQPYRRLADPVEHLWNLSKKPMSVDVVKLVEDSWRDAESRDLIRPRGTGKRKKGS